MRAVGIRRIRADSFKESDESAQIPPRHPRGAKAAKTRKSKNLTTKMSVHWAYLSQELRCCEKCDEIVDGIRADSLLCFEKYEDIQDCLSMPPPPPMKKRRLESSKMWTLAKCVCPPAAVLTIPECTLPACSLQAPTPGQSGSTRGGE